MPQDRKLPGLDEERVGEIMMQRLSDRQAGHFFSMEHYLKDLSPAQQELARKALGGIAGGLLDEIVQPDSENG